MQLVCYELNKRSLNKKKSGRSSQTQMQPPSHIRHIHLSFTVIH